MLRQAGEQNPAGVILLIDRRPQLLRHTQPSLRRPLSHMQQVVLQLARINLRKPHRQPSRPGKAQRSHPSCRLTLRRNNPRML